MLVASSCPSGLACSCRAFAVPVCVSTPCQHVYRSMFSDMVSSAGFHELS